MTTTDRRDATDAQFADELARLDRLDVADVAADVREASPLAFAEWVVSLDDDDPSSPGRIDRRTVTLTQIVNHARAAIAALKPAPGTDTSGQAVQRVEPGLSAESNGRRLAWFTDAELEVELTRRAAVAGPQRDDGCCEGSSYACGRGCVLAPAVEEPVPHDCGLPNCREAGDDCDEETVLERQARIASQRLVQIPEAYR